MVLQTFVGPPPSALDDARPTETGLAASLRSLAECQLLMQTSRSAALDTGALGAMALDAALATIVLSIGRTHLWILALSLLGLSLTLAAGVLSLPGAERTGPSITRMRRDRANRDDSDALERLLDGLEQDIHTNDRAIVRKATLFDGAITLLLFAIVVALAGRL
jgi:lysylphosphatidylglycerol synthetase-like protein (DUF2156 family)